MKLIIAGSRSFKNAYRLVFAAFYQIGLKSQDITEIVSGGAEGVDIAGEQFAEVSKIPKKLFYIKKSDWDEKGLVAGPMRNRQMAQYADALLLIWDGKSKGSLSMRNEMKKLNKPIYEVIINKVQ